MYCKQVAAVYFNNVSWWSVRYRYIWSKNDVISSVRKHICALGLGLGLELELELGLG